MKNINDQFKIIYKLQQFNKLNYKYYKNKMNNYIKQIVKIQILKNGNMKKIYTLKLLMNYRQKFQN